MQRGAIRCHLATSNLVAELVRPDVVISLVSVNGRSVFAVGSRSKNVQEVSVDDALYTKRFLGFECGLSADVTVTKRQQRGAIRLQGLLIRYCCFKTFLRFFSLECGRARFSVDSVNGGSSGGS